MYWHGMGRGYSPVSYEVTNIREVLEKLRPCINAICVEKCSDAMSINATCIHSCRKSFSLER